MSTARTLPAPASAARPTPGPSGRPARSQLEIGRIAILRDELLMHSMLKRVADLPEAMFLPVLRLVTEDPEAIDEQWRTLVAKRRPRGLFEHPRHSWERQYGQFVAELEWVTSELLRYLPFPDVERLVSDAVATRLRQWLRFLLPMFHAVKVVPKAWYAPVMDIGVGMSTFLVGPIYRTGEEPGGTLVFEIPECAMHVVAGTNTAQENSCQMGCKAACEKVFAADGPMPLNFDPHLPGMGCTLRVHRPADRHRRGSDMTSIDSNLIPTYFPLYEEHDYTIDDVTGELPGELRGTLYRNGPGKMEAGGTQLGHLFDGDGMLTMYSMSDGGVRFRNRFVQTKHYQRSIISDGAPFRALGTMREGRVLANALQLPANVANTAVVMHAGKLLALWEGGRPTELDPDTLRTKGEYDYDGELKWLGAFSAHPKWDWETGEMYNFGMAMAPIPKLICYRVDRAGKMHRLGEVRLPGPMFNHDVGLTKRYMVFVIPPLVFPLKKFFGAAFGLLNYVDAIDYDASIGTTIALVPRGGGKPRIIHTDPMLHLHFSNAYDDENGDVVVDVLNYHATWKQLNGQLAGVETLAETSTMPFGGRPTRLRISASGKVSIDEFSSVQGEFPIINVAKMARPNRYFYMSAATGGNINPNALAKIDNETGRETLFQFPEGELPQEAVFAARPGAIDEDDGWLIGPVLNTVNKTAKLEVFDAKDIQSGPVYVGRLRHHLPLSFHGCYTPRIAVPR